MIYKYHDIKANLKLCKSGFNIDLPTFESHCKTYTKDDILVFDDGDITQIQALPVLHKYGLKAMFMIIAGKIGMPEYFGDKEIKQILSFGYLIGNHTHTHYDLTTLSIEGVMIEIALANEVLKRYSNIEYFTAPYEKINMDVRYVCGLLNLKIIEKYKTITNANFRS